MKKKTIILLSVLMVLMMLIGRNEIFAANDAKDEISITEIYDKVLDSYKIEESSINGTNNKCSATKKWDT